MRTNRPRRQIKRPAVSALPARRSQFLLMNRWRISFLVAVVCLVAGYGTVWVAERRAIREVDRKFLDNFVRQQSQDADILSSSGRNIGTAGKSALSRPLVLRAELVVNSSIVRRGEPVVHSGIVKPKRPSITTSPQNSQAAAEFARRLN
jgi:hypothetical protein